jgi:very-short-patch-repair endonuclease
MVWVQNARNLRERRRELRKNSNTAERVFWNEVRGGKLGTKFKRQNSIGGYIADFYCQKAKLIIELDGGIHDSEEAIEYDKIRDKYFEGLGYTILRYKNEDVLENMDNILNTIQLILIRTVQK